MMKTAYTNAKILTGVLDDDGDMPVTYGTLIVEDGIITGVYGISAASGETTSHAARDDVPSDSENAASGNVSEDVLRGCKIVNMNGSYILPGLINMHVHIASGGGPEKPNHKPVNFKQLFEKLTKHPLIMAIFMKMQEKNVRDFLYSGVTTMRTVGGVLDHDGRIRDRVNAGKVPGPRMLVCNTAVSVPGGHFAGSLATEAESPEMAREHVRQIAATDPDWIKLMITGGVMDAVKVGEPGIMRMSPDIVKAACDEAHKLGYKVCAHVECSEGVRVALENGVDCVEHGATLDDYMIGLFKEKQAIAVCTLSVAAPCALCDSVGGEFSTINSKVVLDGFTRYAKSCIQNSIPLGMGTDAGCPNTTSYNTWHELVFWVQMLGVSPAFALYSATLNNARLLGLGSITGSLEAGKFADFIVTQKNPLEDLSALNDLQMVCAGGRMYKKPRIKKNQRIEEIWNEILASLPD